MDICLIGITGKMGKAILDCSLNYESVNIKYGVASLRSLENQTKIAEIKSKYGVDSITSSDLDETIKLSDVVIDFSTPDLCMKALETAIKHNKNFISGTTGFSSEEFVKLKNAGNKIPILWSSNMSIGVNVLNILAAQAAQMLKNYDVEICEMHHKHKKDAPSGTALTLGEKIAEAKKIKFNDVAVKSREGISQSSRNQNEIGFAALRGGSVIGDHNVIFAGENDIIEIKHHAQNRSIFANGALEAAIWSLGKARGFYEMKDILTDI